MSREVMKQALEALEWVNASPHLQDLHHAFDEEINDLKQALAEPEQPVSLNSGRLTQYPDGSIGVGTPTPQPEPPVAFLADAMRFKVTLTQHDCKITNLPRELGGRWVALVAAEDDCHMKLAAPTPQREHITDGSPCWCNPDVFEEDGGNVIVHNYEDNWQQYAKPGETAQQCIERHRSEQDALMKLYAAPRKPLTDEKIWNTYKNLWMFHPAEEPRLAGDVLKFARAIERAHGIGEQT